MENRKYASKTMYDEEFKMWVTVRCPLEEDNQAIKDKNILDETIKSIHINQHLRGI